MLKIIIVSFRKYPRIKACFCIWYYKDMMNIAHFYEFTMTNTEVGWLTELYVPILNIIIITLDIRSCHGRDRMIVGFTTTYAISIYHH